METTKACIICGSTRSHRSPLPTGEMVCDANLNGRNRCREREIAKMIREATAEGGQAMTLNEAAKVLGVDPGTLRVQVHNGKLRARKVGPIWTVTPREVERYRRESLRMK